MSIPATGSAQSTAPGMITSEPLREARDLGKQDFLMLLIAQLRNQDPLRPMEDTAFIAQLAQFNTLEQMQQLNDTMTSLNEWSMLGQIATLVGKQVLVADPDGGEPVAGVVTSVTFFEGLPRLTVNGKLVDVGQVVAITTPEQDAAS